jgi:hypothetical protein
MSQDTPRPDGPIDLWMVMGVYIPVCNGRGWLTIRQGAIILEPGRILRRLTSVTRIVHTDPKVTMICPRVAPPWINTHILVEDPGQAAIAGTWGFARRRLRRALQTAGFEIVDLRTWFSWGDYLADWPMRRGRAAAPEGKAPSGR